ncbi:BURP domain protein RD22-like [Vitis riparia]|uniref:BURP domain protein RD22-like n=1 Tax=Vitis riparia TaxID=96939 RepID=UPI00155AA316|nr:BURP domain protein RD22-like [Vitis riparia]
MELHLLPILTCLSLVVVVSNASLPSEVYWKLALSYTPMPKAVRDLLQLNSMEGGSSINVSKVVLNAIPADVFIKYQNPLAVDTPTEDQPQDTSRKGYFLEKDLHSTTKMKMHFRKTTNEATFLPRQVADSIPFSSDKFPEILNRFSLKQDSEEAEIMKETIQDCEQPALEGDSRFCATSLESLIDFSISKLGKNIKLISNGVEMGSQEYELGVGVKVVADKSVVCHKQKYPYAVFYCHAIHKTRVYTLPFVGTEDGTKAEVVASCHIDTSAWNPKHAAFQVLKVKPGTVPVCHFLPRDDLIWVPK